MVFGKYWMKNMKASSKESEKHQQTGLGSFHMRNYPTPYRIMLSMLQTPIRFEERIRMNQRIQLMVKFLSILIHDDLLVKDAVGPVKIHNPILI